MSIRVTVWGENVHEQTSKVVQEVYPMGMHNCIADALNEDPEIQARTATLQEPEHGLTEEVLQQTDVLTWWGHAAHGKVEDQIVDRVQARVLEGMGSIGAAHCTGIIPKSSGGCWYLRGNDLLADLAGSWRNGTGLGL